MKIEVKKSTKLILNEWEANNLVSYLIDSIKYHIENNTDLEFDSFDIVKDYSAFKLAKQLIDNLGLDYPNFEQNLETFFNKESQAKVVLQNFCKKHSNMTFSNIIDNAYWAIRNLWTVKSVEFDFVIPKSDYVGFLELYLDVFEAIKVLDLVKYNDLCANITARVGSYTLPINEIFQSLCILKDFCDSYFVLIEGGIVQTAQKQIDRIADKLSVDGKVLQAIQMLS